MSQDHIDTCPRGTLGSVSVPSACWSVPGFKKLNDDAYATAQNMCADGKGGYDQACVDLNVEIFQGQNVDWCQKQLAAAKKEPSTTEPAEESKTAATSPWVYFLVAAAVTGVAFVAIKAATAR